VPSDIVVVPDESRITFTSSTNNVNAITQVDDGTLNVQNNFEIDGILQYSGFAGFQTINLVTRDFSIVTNGEKTQSLVIVPFYGEIVSWQIIANTQSTLTLDVWKGTGGIPSSSNSITGSAKPSLTNQQFASSSNLIGWDTFVRTNDIFVLEVESNNNASQISLTLAVRTYLITPFPTLTPTPTPTVTATLTPTPTPTPTSTPPSPPVFEAGSTSTSASNSFSVDAPSGVVNGDLLVTVIDFEKGSTEVINLLSGWTLLVRTNNSTNAGQAIYYKVANNEPSTYTWTITQGSKTCIGVARISNASSSNILSNASTGTGTAVTAPTLTTAVDNCLILAFYTNKSSGTYTGVTTERWDAPNTGGGLPSNMLATFNQTTAGSTGDKTATVTASESWVATQVAIRPA
jgi:hypothetical protein